VAPSGPKTERLPVPSWEIVTYTALDAWRAKNLEDRIRVKGKAYVRPALDGVLIEWRRTGGARIAFANPPAKKAAPLAGQVKEEETWDVTVEGRPVTVTRGVLFLRDAELLRAEEPTDD
jgi:hypothetical protein